MGVKLKDGKLNGPIRFMIYGRPKVGKTTAAMETDDPIVISAEAGDGGFDVKRVVFDAKTDRYWPVSWDEVMREVRAIRDERQLLGKTIVFDGLGALEKLCAAHVCASQTPKWSSITEPGFSKGEGALLAEMERFVKIVEECWAKGYSIVFVCHSKIGKVKNPAGEEYPRHCPDLTDVNRGDVSGYIVGWVDVALFAEVEVLIDNKRKDKRTLGTSTGRHVFRTRNTAAWVGGCRYDNVPETMDLDMRQLLQLIAEGRSVEKMTAKVNRLLTRIDQANEGATKIREWMAQPGAKDIKLLCRAAARLEAELEEQGDTQAAA